MASQLKNLHAKDFTISFSELFEKQSSIANVSRLVGLVMMKRSINFEDFRHKVDRFCEQRRPIFISFGEFSIHCKILWRKSSISVENQENVNPSFYKNHRIASRIASPGGKWHCCCLLVSHKLFECCAIHSKLIVCFPFFVQIYLCYCDEPRGLLSLFSIWCSHFDFFVMKYCSLFLHCCPLWKAEKNYNDDNDFMNWNMAFLTCPFPSMKMTCLEFTHENCLHYTFVPLDNPIKQ